MTEYLKKTKSMNGLLKSVLKDLEVPFFIAGCKALSLISGESLRAKKSPLA